MASDRVNGREVWVHDIRNRMANPLDDGIGRDHLLMGVVRRKIVGFPEMSTWALALSLQL
jgi:hypothetical protein